MRYSRSSNPGQWARLNGIARSNPLIPRIFTAGRYRKNHTGGREAKQRPSPCCVHATTAQLPRWHPALPAFCSGGARRSIRPAHSSPEVRLTSRHRLRDSGLQVFTTCPPSYTAAPESYLRDVVTVARWSDAAQCEGMLIYTDNGLVDPWSVAQAVIPPTERLAPLVAVPPIYMHPYAVAKLVATLGFLYGRRVSLNMVAGGFKNDPEALGHPTPHDERYARLVEYTTIIKLLLSTPGPVTFAGQHYRLTNVRLAPALPPGLMPGVFVSGSSDAGLAAARELRALAVRYPKPLAEYEDAPPPDRALLGIRIRIIAREDSGEAWGAGRQRFPQDR